MADEVTDCIVVGAGFAGLSAATRLTAQGRSVLLLEARDRVGGRVKPGRIAGCTVDVGGMWLAPSQRRLAALADRFGVATFPTPLAGRNVVTLAGRRGHARGDDFLPALSLVAKLDLLQADLRLKWMQRSLAVERPWAHRRAGEWDRMNLGDWVRRTCRTRTAWTVFEAICRSLFCAEPDQVSLLFVLFYLKSGEGLDRLISAAAGGAQNLLAEGGLHQIAAALAEALGERVRLGCPVTAIDQGGGEVVVRSGSTAVRARSVIVAVPPPLLADIAFTPALPEAKRQLLAGQVMGSCIKVWVAYERPFWREAGLNGFAALDAHPFNPFWDAGPPGGGAGLIVGFFDAVHAVDWRDRTPAARRDAVLAAIGEALGPAAAVPIDYLEQDWNGEAWTRGCYGAYLAPGTLAAHGPALREPVGRVFWAGTETATEWSGYIEGAIQSGERAADAVLAGDR